MRKGGKFLKNHKDDKVWWYYSDTKGPLEISFDRKKIYNLWIDYPHNMTSEEVEIFDRENPYWAEYFTDRKMATEEQSGNEQV